MVGVARADVIPVLTPPTLSTEVLRLYADGSQVMGTSGGNVQVSGDLYDTISTVIAWNPTMGVLDITAGIAHWTFSSAGLVGAGINGFSVKSSDWLSLFVFGFGAQEFPSGLFAYLTNPDSNVSMVETENVFNILANAAFFGDAELTFNLDNAVLDLGSSGGSGSGGSTSVSEPGALALVILALVALGAARRRRGDQSRTALIAT